MWGCGDDEIPGAGITAQEIIEAIDRGEIKGLLSICFNPAVSAPDTRLTAEALEKLEFYAVIDFFLSESGRYADVVLPGSLHEEDEGTVTTGEGRIVKINQAVDPPGEARKDWQILCELARRLGKGHYFPYTDTEQIFEELRLASAGGTADYRGATWQRIEDEMGLFWPVPEEGHPGTPRLFEGGRFFHPDGKAHFHAIPFREAAEVVDDEYPLTARRAAWSRRTSAARRLGASPSSWRSTRNRCARSTRSSPRRSASPTAISSRSPRGGDR